jgi:hypothetical protein
MLGPKILSTPGAFIGFNWVQLTTWYAQAKKNASKVPNCTWDWSPQPLTLLLPKGSTMPYSVLELNLNFRLHAPLHPANHAHAYRVVTTLDSYPHSPDPYVLYPILNTKV